MKLKHILSLIVAVIVVCSFTGKRPASFVLDKNHVFTDSQKAQLNAIYARHELKTSNEIALLTIGSFAPETDIHIYGVKQARELGVGKRDKNNGVLITLCVNCRKVDISTGKGTENVLKDEIAKKIIDEIMTPQFKNGDYFGGIYNGSKAIIDLLEKPGNEIK
jgi:uncharacterized protein